jgi:hypothetical protein
MLLLAWAFPHQPSQAQVAAAKTGGDRRPRRGKDAAAESKKSESRERSGPRAVFVVLTSAEFGAGGGAGSGDQCCAVTQSGFLSF